MRLNKFLAHCGVASRRKSDDIIQQGRVRINGETVDEPGREVDPDTDTVEVDGEDQTLEELVYYRYHKPVGQASTLSDPHIEWTLEPIVDEIEQRVFPVGRLDQDSRGLLLLTNDGDLTHVLSHPRYGIEKTYRVTVDREPPGNFLQCLREGELELDGESTMPVRVDVKDDTHFELKLKEGRNRQIRRMFELSGIEVTDLYRTAIGPVNVFGLPEEECEALSEKWIEALRGRVPEDE
ncbi:MAG: pseudouridine synthase [bacterium]